MNRPRIFGIGLLSATLLVSLSGCARTSKPADSGMAQAIKPGFTHGMPASNPGPAPAWFAQRFNRARGVGEAMRRDSFSLWDHETNSYAYYVGGVLYAEYQPLQHVLQIRGDPRDDTTAHCRWGEDGALSAEPAGAEESCRQLLDELERRIARTGKFPVIGSS